MTPIYDPTDPTYRDEADTRREFSRTAEVCFGCRRCIDRCDVFPRLIDLVERFDDHDPGGMTPEEQDGLATACLHCGACAHECPFATERADRAVDVPRLMLRMAAMRRHHGHDGWRERVASRVVASPSLRDRAVASWFGLSGPARSRLRRRGVTPSTGPTSRRVLLVAGACPGAHDPQTVGAIGAVLAHLGVEVSVARVRDCGASLLHAGELDRFARRARSNVRTLADELRSDDSLTLVVLDPVCLDTLVEASRRVLRNGESDDPDASLVAGRATDGSELVRELGATASAGRAAAVGTPSIAYLDGCHPAVGRAWPETLASAGADVHVVADGCGGCGGWSRRPANATSSIGRIHRLAGAVHGIVDAGGLVVAGCGATVALLREHHGIEAVHPLIGWARVAAIETDPPVAPPS